jgi:hypothetical protein
MICKETTVPMQTDTIAVPKDVMDLLKTKSAEEEYRVTEQLIRENFPEMQSLDVYLQEDPDEDGITRVILEVVLPETMPFEILSERRNMFYGERHRRLPALEWPVCGLSVSFS